MPAHLIRENGGSLVSIGDATFSFSATEAGADA